ncbi:MAG TPA: EamA family transporter, partial [Actinomycetota bacterium]|nr:EamA family transporter [Actinomycetota bacterium]
VRRLSIPRGRALIGPVLYGVFLGGAFGAAYYALITIQAGLGQMLLALVPLATLLLAVAVGQERLRVASLVGSVVAIAGIVVISAGSFGGSVPVLPLLAVFGGVLCFSAATVTARRFPSVHPVMMNAVGMTTAAVLLISGSAIAREPFELPDLLATWMAVAYIAAVGSIVVFVLYLVVVRLWNASRAAYTFVITPVVTVLLSAWLDNEPIGLGLVLGGLLVLSGVYVGALRPTTAAGDDTG